MVRAGGWTGWGVSKGINAVKRGGSGRKVPLDLYGHVPSQISAYKSWYGFAFSLAVYLVVGASVGYVLYEYLTLPYDLAEAESLYDAELPVDPAGEVPIPEIGVRFSLKNTSFFDVTKHPEILDIFFWQTFIFGNGSCLECRKRVRIPSERCRFMGENDNDVPIDAFCPQWGTIEEVIDADQGITESTFQPVDVRENATVPTMQGNFLDETYAFIEADIQVNLSSIDTLGAELDVRLDDIYGGEIIYLVATNEHNLDDIGISDKVPLEFKVWSKRVEVKEYGLSKVDIPLVVRSIEHGNFLVDFDFLANEYLDMIVGTVEQELDDAEFVPTIYNLQNVTGTIPQDINKETGIAENITVPDTIKVSKAFFHVGRSSRSIVMTPPSTLFDILGIVGGFLSLFSLLLGWPAMLLNSWKFNRALNKAKKQGLIDEDYLNEEGELRMDKANEAVEKLQGINVGVFSFKKRKNRGWFGKKSGSVTPRTGSSTSDKPSTSPTGNDLGTIAERGDRNDSASGPIV